MPGQGEQLHMPWGRTRGLESHVSCWLSVEVAHQVAGALADFEREAAKRLLVACFFSES